jgi:mannose-6-phosphate isomerase-like protein (cupin superfamily)
MYNSCCEEMAMSDQRRDLEPGDVITDPVHGETVRFLEIGTDHSATRMELRVEPQASGPPGHIHPRSHERFEVRSGAIWLTSHDEQRAVGAGERITIPPGTPHTWHNHTDQPAVVVVEMDPGFSVAQFLDDWYGLARAGRLNKKGDLGLLHSAVLVVPHTDVMAMPGIPLRVQRPLLRSLSWLGRHRGYEV